VASAGDQIPQRWIFSRPALFSPPYYPQYNGGIENTQGETKPLLRRRLAAAPV